MARSVRAFVDMGDIMGHRILARRLLTGAPPELFLFQPIPSVPAVYAVLVREDETFDPETQTPGRLAWHLLNGLDGCMYSHAPVLPSSADAAAYMELVMLGNEAIKLTKSNKFPEAETLLRDVLQRKPGAGFDSVSIALTKNELGGVLRQLGQFDEALTLLTEALEVRERCDEAADITIALRDGSLTREEIAKVYEAKGDCAKALETRVAGKRICGSETCEALDYKKLQECSRCKCVFYCGKTCQGLDWKNRHRPLCQPKTKAP
ncbi:hypothetical protein BBO99_00002568 [Phytophthora kernoviae]|uniref:MYND-type domain-containing protein n=2 Tax=Phytophthora kernoviae TaxID=325452 RepID=A0A3R7K5G7_9STRA|nr:hypothetical protein G195_004308 [Phytophthora kernoviae 00238/432]KAG2527299.1 hypothetical protein JM16_003509 [Phytophthora kernoviae]RLN20932.1 hypothetical protein BBI17_002467 [Phytophthora kernoviae]RLN82891.1 hypothetical protein BBO99_00002568 [Phytophthora kernoviae]